MTPTPEMREFARWFLVCFAVIIFSTTLIVRTKAKDVCRTSTDSDERSFWAMLHLRMLVATLVTSLIAILAILTDIQP